MKKYSVYIILTLIAGALSVGFIAQDEKLATFLEKFERYSENRPQEKIHLHFDKPYYSIGDEIWFKAYLVNAEENKLSTLSKILYVDLIDEKDSVNKTLLLPLENGLTYGSIKLVDSIFTSGLYHLRAYTNWMRNFEESYFFHKDIPVGDALNGSVIATAKFDLLNQSAATQLSAEISYADFKNQPQVSHQVSYQLRSKGEIIFEGSAKTDELGNIYIKHTLKKGYDVNELMLNTVFKKNEVTRTVKNFEIGKLLPFVDVQFFPEGGYLVNNIRSKVAFKATGQGGYGADVKGYVVDQNQNRIAELEVNHAGMGLFAFIPTAGNSYTAVINLGNDRQQRYSLPKAIEQGYVLNLNHLDEENLALRVDCSKEMVQNQEIVIIAQSNGLTKHVSKINMDKSVLISKLPKKLLGEGIVQFTLFSPDYQPVAERLVFIKSQKVLNANVNADKAIYAKRERVSIGMSVANAEGNGVVGSFSVSVVNQQKVKSEEKDEVTIWSNLLLTSDLRGFIEQPNYYFINVDQRKVKELDILMLTQGWRRFRWDDVINPKEMEFKFLPEKALSISGTITNLGKKPIPFGKVNLFVPSMFALIDTVADANGRFTFDQLNFPDSTKFIVRAKNFKDRNNVRIVLDVSAIPPFQNSRVVIEPNQQQAFVNYLYESEKMYNDQFKNGLLNRTIMLKQVEIKNRLPRVIEKSALPAFMRADHTLTPDKLQSAGNLTSLLTNLSNVYIRNNSIYGLKRGKMGKMLILLDGLPIPSLDGINPMALSGVQIITANSVGTGIEGLPSNFDPDNEGSAGYGVVFLTLETKGTKYNTVLPSGMSHIKPNGYAVVREFYAPVYNSEGQNSKIADLRSTIHWEPNIISDENGKANLSFYTADEPGQYLITLEGVSLTGQLARQTKVITVR